MLEQLRVILEVREREWQRLRPAIDRGIISPADAETAKRRLAVARLRLAGIEQRETDAREQFRLVAELCDRQVDRLLRAYAQRAVPLRDVNAARYRAGCARYVLAKAGGGHEDIAREIDRAVALWEGEVERLSRLYETGAVEYFVTYQARACLFDVRLRRATIAGDHDTAAEQLKLRIRLAEEALPRLDLKDAFLRRLRPSIESLLAFDRLYLDRLQRDGILPPDRAAAELDG